MTAPMSEALALTTMLALLDECGLAVDGWTAVVNHRTKRRLGRCRYSQKVIEVSAWILADPVEARDTILHELAHALAGPEAGHGPVWKAWAVKVGAKPEQYACLSETLRAVPRHKWKSACMKCGHEYRRIRLSKRLKLTAHCGLCKRSPETKLSWRMLAS